MTSHCTLNKIPTTCHVLQSPKCSDLCPCLWPLGLVSPLPTVFQNGLFFSSNVQRFSFILDLGLLYPLTRVFFFMAFECQLHLTVHDSGQIAPQWPFLTTKSKIASHSLSNPSLILILFLESFTDSFLSFIDCLLICLSTRFDCNSLENRTLFLLLICISPTSTQVSGTYKVLKMS